MDILIIADFCGKMDGTGNSRFLYIAEKLSAEHTVEILTSDFDHDTKSYFEQAPSGFPFQVTMVHEGIYKKNVSLRRFWAHFIWGRSVKKYLSQRKKPDVIYAAIPPLTAPLAAAKYCERNHIRFVIDIQDLWPDGFQMVFNVPILSSIIFAPLKWLADGVYKRADQIIAVSDTYMKRGMRVNRKCKQGMSVFLGTELETFDANARENPIQIMKPANEVWLAYCGTLGASYDLTVVFDAMRLLQADDLKFIVMGAGEREAEFKRQAEGLNVLFTGRLPYPQMCGVLARCDIAVNPIMPRAAQSIINKHADYAASGLAVINTQECAEYRELIETYHMGFNCENGNPRQVADKLERLRKDETLRKEMGQNARRCAEEKFDRKRAYQDILRSIQENH